MDKDYKHSLNTIKKMLRDYPMSQNTLAQKLGVTEGTVSRWLSGSRSMSAETLVKIWKILGVTGIELKIK